LTSSIELLTTINSIYPSNAWGHVDVWLSLLAL